MSKLRSLSAELDIQVDGGVSPDTIDQCSQVLMRGKQLVECERSGWWVCEGVVGGYVRGVVGGYVRGVVGGYVRGVVGGYVSGVVGGYVREWLVGM